MCFTFEKSNKQTKKPVNRFLQDDASAGIRSIEIKLCQSPLNGIYCLLRNFNGFPLYFAQCSFTEMKSTFIKLQNEFIKDIGQELLIVNNSV